MKKERTPEQLAAARVRNKRWELNHPGAKAAYRAAHKKEIKAANMARYAVNHEEILAKQHIYNATHKEQKAVTNKAYRLVNQEAIRLKRQMAYRANREIKRQQSAVSYQKCKAKRLEENRQWAKDHPEEVRKIKARYRDAHRKDVRKKGIDYQKKLWEEKPEQMRLRAKVWRQAHPEVFRAAAKKRRARKKGAPINDLTQAQWEFIKVHYGHRCVYCGRKMKRLTMDHITPLIQGGNHTASNIVPACQSCNSRKNAGPVLRPVQPLLLTA